MSTGDFASNAATRVNPVAKIAALLPLTACLLLSFDWVSATTAVLGEVAVAVSAGVPSRSWTRTLPIWWGAGLTGITVLLYGQRSGHEYWHAGPITISDGSIALSAVAAVRLVALGLPAVLVFATVDPTALADGLAQLVRLPSRFVIGALAGFRTVALVQDDWRTLGWVRHARGVADHHRLRRVTGQAFALTVLTMRRAEQLATAMEARGFGATNSRTWARPSTFRAADWLTIALGVLLAASMVTAALLARTWNLVLP